MLIVKGVCTLECHVEATSKRVKSHKTKFKKCNLKISNQEVQSSTLMRHGAKRDSKTASHQTKWSLGKEGIVPSRPFKGFLHQVKQ